MMQVQWTLKTFLREHGLTAYRLAKAIPDVREPTVYRLASDRAPESVNFALLGRVLHGLSKLTGEKVELSDVMEVVEVQTPAVRKPVIDVANMKKFNLRPLPEPLAHPIDTTALVAEIRGKDRDD